MPSDYGAMGDNAGSEEQRSAQPAAQNETPADVEHSTSLRKAPTPVSNNGEPRTESMEGDKPNLESESRAEVEAGNGDTDIKPQTFDAKIREAIQTGKLSKDIEAKIDTRYYKGAGMRRSPWKFAAIVTQLVTQPQFGL